MVTETRKGLLSGITAYVAWGLFPLYWPLLKPAGALEILAHRMMWSLIVVAVLLATRRNWSWIRELAAHPRRVALLAAAALLITVNWGTYIYAVNNGHTIEAALGYFINPLLSVVFGVLIFRERLRRSQWAAVGLGVVAVVVIAIAYGRVPWIALILASSFGTYGLFKKLARTGSVESMTVETTVLFIPALIYVICIQASGSGTLTNGPGHLALLACSGIVTAIPLMLFNSAATRVPLTVLGLLQYLAPVLQFLIGVGVQHEPMPASRWIGFLLVWGALLILTADGLAQRRAPKNLGGGEDPLVEVVDVVVEN